MYECDYIAKISNKLAFMFKKQAKHFTKKNNV